ncbi:hypothetical protein MHYP_G00240250 [Metynnis hypsauchen]
MSHDDFLISRLPIKPVPFPSVSGHAGSDTYLAHSLNNGLTSSWLCSVGSFGPLPSFALRGDFEWRSTERRGAGAKVRHPAVKSQKRQPVFPVVSFISSGDLVEVSEDV